MKENLIHYRTCVCNINYHMVWSVKYRRKILNAEVEAYLQELVQEIAEDKGFTVHLFECGEGDHVHCFVSAPPKLSITAIVKYLKGDLRQETFRTFSGNKKPALERGAVEPFLLCGNGRICIGRKHPQVHRTSEQALLILWRRGNAAVKENIHKGQPGICESHRTYVLCSIQALECL